MYMYCTYNFHLFFLLNCQCVPFAFMKYYGLPLVGQKNTFKF